MTSATDPFRVTAPAEAALWMLTASLVFAAGNALIRHITAALHPFEVVFFRNLFSLLFMGGWVAANGLGVLRTARLGLFFTRSAISLAAMLTWFYGVSVVPLGDATALSFVTPLFATIGAALFLGETVRLRRWGAVAAGLLGVAIILRPGADALSAGALIILASCVFASIGTLQVRTLAGKEPAPVVVTYMVLFLTPMSLIPALFVWTWPDRATLGWLALLGGMLTAGHLALTRAFQRAEASALMPYDFVKLPATALIAYVLFGEVMDAWAWIGAAIIIGSALYVAHREAVLARAARAAAASAALRT